MESRPPLVGAPKPEQPATPSVLLLVAVGVAAGLVGFLIGVTTGGGDEPDPLDTVSTPVPAATTATTQADDGSSSSSASSSSAPTTATSGDATGPLVPSTPRRATTSEVKPLEGVGALAGDVALTPFPGASGGSTLWVVRAGGSVVRRDKVPFWPGDFPHPMLMTEERIAFAGLDHAYLIDADLVEPPAPLTEASFVVPGSTPGLVWLAGEGAEWVAPLDVQSGTVGERFDVGDLFWWPLAGVADGLFVSPVDEASYGRAAYWSPTEGLRPINLPDPLQSGIHAAAGNLAVVVSSGVIDIFDLAVGNYVTSFPIQLGEGIVSEVCLSPGQETVAIVGSTGQVDVVETRTGAVLLRLSGVHAFNAMGWTSPEQLVYIADLDERTRRIYAVDVATGAIHNIADLEGAIGWWLTASGAMC